MDSSSKAPLTKEKGLSAEGVAVASHPGKPAPSPNSTAEKQSGCKNGTSLDNTPYKKVGQFPARGCKNSQELYFTCKQGHIVERDIRCNSRFVQECPRCAKIWRKKTVKRYSKCVSEMQNPKLVTLTLRKSGKHGLEELPELVHRYRKYLRRKGYDVKRFVGCLEPPNHVHGVWDVNYIPQHQMSQIWEDVTKDSFVVDIRNVDKHRWHGAVRYIAKYITKISESGVGMKGLHIINSWGNEKPPEVRMICKRCGSYFSPLWDLSYGVEKYADFDFVEVNDYG